MVGDLWSNQKYNIKNQDKALDDPTRTTMDDSAPAIPCGLVAKSVFNDTFELWKEDQTAAEGKVKIEIEETGIAWSSDITYKF